MAMVKCSECQKEISDKAGSCPHCGCPISSTGSGKASGTVKIKMPEPDKYKDITRVLISALFRQTCTIVDAITNEPYWQGRRGQIAEFHLSKAADVVIKFGLMTNPLCCRIDPKGNAKYVITQDMGVHMFETYNISKADFVN